ncbi:LLM class flavin-dependent oxidoreductase [Mycobacterium sp. ITM-2016-00316]|uniref:LLM class flavin-dependent oxidoreductase n=1 Tax=Mycobacterium sp. ITM-2016-00316 TaxID=2099695 RepID=UPI0026CA32B1|nr:LLM class flavin-dependent oxidoreductase [Mycobacterium sp. ITM-2016-00316]WNG81547.1 LLM class flavin-dependent oxidoreductase [Mycobacterium sp. ITM-2016-00316]
MNAPLDFGVFITPFHPTGQSPTLALQYDMDRVEALDRLGYDEAWFGEHHSGGYELIACPEVFIAAAAERTRHIRLGTGVVSLPYHHPLMVADRWVLLDHLTRGRVMFGTGPGALPSDAYMMGIDPVEQRRMMQESLDAILALFRAGPEERIDFSDLGFPDGVDEHHPVRPDGNAYVDTRVASEQVVLQAHAAGEVAVTVIRPGDVYGPASRPWTILPVQMIKANRFVLPAMGKGVFSPVYIDDLVHGVVQAAESPAASGQVLTLSGGVGVPCREFFGHYYRMLGRRGPLSLPTPVAVSLAHIAHGIDRLSGRPGEASATSMRYLARTGTYSIAKARGLIGFDPPTGLVEGMDRTRSWLDAEGLI